jgi:hypothetical protein
MTYPLSPVRRMWEILSPEEHSRYRFKFKIWNYMPISLLISSRWVPNAGQGKLVCEVWNSSILWPKTFQKTQKHISIFNKFEDVSLAQKVSFFSQHNHRWGRFLGSWPTLCRDRDNGVHFRNFGFLVSVTRSSLGLAGGEGTWMLRWSK